MDPITFETMRHPIACNDGRRYSQTTLQKLQRNPETRALICPFTRQDMHVLDPRDAARVRPSSQVRRHEACRADLLGPQVWQRPLYLSNGDLDLADTVINFQRRAAHACGRSYAFVPNDVLLFFGLVNSLAASKVILSFLCEHHILDCDASGNFIFYSDARLTLQRLRDVLRQAPLLAGRKVQMAVDLIGLLYQEFDRQTGLQDYVGHVECFLARPGWFTDPVARANKQNELQTVLSYRDLLPTQLQRRFSEMSY